MQRKSRICYNSEVKLHFCFPGYKSLTNSSCNERREYLLTRKWDYIFVLRTQNRWKILRATNIGNILSSKSDVVFSFPDTSPLANFSCNENREYFIIRKLHCSFLFRHMVVDNFFRATNIENILSSESGNAFLSSESGVAFFFSPKSLKILRPRKSRIYYHSKVTLCFSFPQSRWRFFGHESRQYLSVESDTSFSFPRHKVVEKFYGQRK